MDNVTIDKILKIYNEEVSKKVKKRNLMILKNIR